MPELITIQDVINRTAQRFLVDKLPFAFEKNKIGKLICLYRGPNGEKCAIGHEIPDDRYLSKMEGENVRTVFNMSSFLGSMFEAPQSLAWSELQACHDQVRYIEDDSRRRKELAQHLQILCKNWKFITPDVVTEYLKQ